MILNVVVFYLTKKNRIAKIKTKLIILYIRFLTTRLIKLRYKLKFWAWLVVGRGLWTIIRN